MKRLENVLFGSLYDPIEFGKEDEEKVQDEAETGSAMYFVRDDKNSHGDGYPRRFSPFGEDLHTNVCSINNEDVSLSLLQRSLLLPTLDFSFFFSLCMRSQKYVRDAGGFAGVNPPMPKLAQVAAPSGTLTALLWANVGSRIALNGSGSCAHSLGDGEGRRHTQNIGMDTERLVPPLPSPLPSLYFVDPSANSMLSINEDDAQFSEESDYEGETWQKKPAWVDEEEGNTIVNIAKVNRVGPVDSRSRDGDPHDGSSDEETGAVVARGHEDVEAVDDILRTDEDLVVKSSAKLSPGLLEFSRLVDANAEDSSNGPINSVQFHRNAQFLLVAGEEESLEFFEVLPDPSTIAFVGNEGYILLVSSKTKELIGTLKMNGTVRSLAFANGGKQLLSSGGDGQVYHWDLRTRMSIHKAGCINDTALCTSPDGAFFAAGSDSGMVNNYNRVEFIG
ncbi:U3 small nucleolar RNA-associated protein 18-like [Citrus sinensis]|uniref:U3 small nucleolar RNA-associated protein 18-like n=1 Tax=Citrus sinensis TaxID=2711 RepID=A0ACB8HYA5_CITSI|nr:U3 small nucleolar RNA-associated protein 18-like [Citrus sinensis]